MAEAAACSDERKGIVGRHRGDRKTTSVRLPRYFQTFEKLSSPGRAIHSQVVHKALPTKLKKKICRRTVIRRLGDKGYKPEMKIQKSDPGPALAKKRVDFCKPYEDLSAQGWKSLLQGAGDFKEFTWYPKELYPKFSKLRAPWTYMTKVEKRKPEFVRPKRWFAKKDYKKAKKQKVFGITTSTGKALVFPVPKLYSAELWAKDVKKHLKPFLKKAYPNKTAFQILLDGEKLLHAPVAKRAMKEAGVSVLPKWPKYSPDLNPQENVWAWAEKKLSEGEKSNSPFEAFAKQVDGSAQKANGCYDCLFKLNLRFLHHVLSAPFDESGVSSSIHR